MQNVPFGLACNKQINAWSEICSIPSRASITVLEINICETASCQILNCHFKQCKIPKERFRIYSTLLYLESLIVFSSLSYLYYKNAQRKF